MSTLGTHLLTTPPLTSTIFLLMFTSIANHYAQKSQLHFTICLQSMATWIRSTP
jgi:hypothetical protein